MSPPAPLPIRAVADDVFVAPQLDPAVVVELARAGIRSVVNNRPDFEGGTDQPTSAAFAAAAQAAGIEYRFLPVSGGTQSAQEIAAFAALLRELPRPLVAFCRTGTRSAKLFAAANASAA
ncbi:MAG: TIGR01244 family sulfur transferase [Rubrivivax sp.]